MRAITFWIGRGRGAQNGSHYILRRQWARVGGSEGEPLHFGKLDGDEKIILHRRWSGGSE